MGETRGPTSLATKWPADKRASATGPPESIHWRSIIALRLLVAKEQRGRERALTGGGALSTGRGQRARSAKERQRGQNIVTTSSRPVASGGAACSRASARRSDEKANVNARA